MVAHSHHQLHLCQCLQLLTIVHVCWLPQVRQHVPHKRTFLYLEQLILRAGADGQCINIKDIHEGLDFFFANRAHGLKFIDFLQVSCLLATNPARLCNPASILLFSVRRVHADTWPTTSTSSSRTSSRRQG